MRTEFKLSNVNKKHYKNESWPKEKKLQVVAQWLSIGNLRLVSEVSGVSYGIIRQWRIQPWWKEFEDEIRRTEGVQLDSKMSRIITKALDAVEDRLENGEEVLNNKTGEIVRKPVRLSDANKVATDMAKARTDLRTEAANVGVIQAIPIQEQLKILAQEFARMTSGKRGEVIEVETVEVLREDADNVIFEEDDDALYEEREEGLQETDGVAEPTGSSSEEDPEQPSPTDDDPEGESEGR